MSYIIAITIYIFCFVSLYKVMSSKWFEENKNKNLGFKYTLIAFIWFVLFVGSQLYIIANVIEYFMA